MSYNIALGALSELEAQLSGVQSKSVVSPTKILNAVVESSEVCRIVYQREGDNVRAIQCSDNAYDVIGIHKSRIEGSLLTAFVDQPIDMVAMVMRLIDRKKVVVKRMFLGPNLIETRGIIIDQGGGIYYELLWRVGDELG